MHETKGVKCVSVAHESSEVIERKEVPRTRVVEAELSYALGLNKVVVPIVYEAIQLPSVFRKFQVFRFSPLTAPGTLESQIIDYLREQKLGKERLQASRGMT